MTSTSGKTPELTLEMLMSMVEQLEKINQPRFWFTPFCDEDKIFKGEMIDKILGLNEREEGIMIHLRWEGVLRDYFDKNPIPFMKFSDFIVEPSRVRR